MDVIIDVIMDFRSMIYTGSTRAGFFNCVLCHVDVVLHKNRKSLKGMKCTHHSTVDSRVMLGRADA